MQLFWYRRLLVKDLSLLESIERAEGSSTMGYYKRLSSLVAQLRKVCNHPYLFAGAEDPNAEDWLGTMVAASGKLSLLDRMLIGLRAKGHRVVIFSQYTRVLDILQDYMQARSFRFLRLDGGTGRLQRVVNIHKFQSGDVPFFLMTTRAEGLASTCKLQTPLS